MQCDTAGLLLHKASGLHLDRVEAGTQQSGQKDGLAGWRVDGRTGERRVGLRCFVLRCFPRWSRRASKQEGTTNAIAVKMSVKKQSQARPEA